MILEKEQLLETIRNVCLTYKNIVGATLGPKGQHVIMGEENPYITKDGITVAKALIDSLSTPQEKAIAKLYDTSIPKDNG
jgi:chaperonin GroEL (HSP60 family)